MLEALVDVGGAPVGRRSARLCCDAVRFVAPAGRTKRRWLDALRDLAAAAGRRWALPSATVAHRCTPLEACKVAR
ncbi:hypothetical protein F511_46625 [Dorcoceras hygrometricum]|uniref:Uncharacterized protein n=1 Tax=Dorcoceras hygrometricum TaxID=472368 RepID=A0A2Z6ZTL3_9LAMI|nr:hypothetical protein F511_46625 [Dorcoceras hygrometricum]